MTIKIVTQPGVEIPSYATQGSAGFDLIAHSFKKLYNAENLTHEYPINITSILNYIELTPGSRVLIGCGFNVELPLGTELQIRTRSGNALKLGLSVLNSPGTIDEDYRGEVGVILVNTSKFVQGIKLGDKIAQAILAPYLKPDFKLVEQLSDTNRGAGGFGSTDVKSKTTENY